MESHSEEHVTKLLPAYTHVDDHSLRFINSMTLKCAIDLSIPDVIHKYGQPMPLSQLIASLPIHSSKACFIHRLMRILTHSGFFSEHKVMEEDEQEVRYVLTDASKLLLKDHPLSMASLMQVTLDPSVIKSWCQFSTWLTNDDPTPFHTANGVAYFDYAKRDPKFNDVYNDAMAKETRFVSSVVIEKGKGVFEGLESLVDVGGGTGTMAKAIAKSFPQLNCIVFDQPHVVANLQGTDNVKYVGGDMFEAIPSADAISLKWVLHCWNDEECVKILKKCKEAIPKQGKVIIVDLVVEDKKDDNKLVEMQLCCDMLMMALFAGKERNEKEWAYLFFSAGFSNYKITPIFDLYYIIEKGPLYLC
ncbi:putative O-methyltransferase 3, partial [Mucuna pruriens]